VIPSRAAVGVASYLTLTAAWIYGVENTSVRLGHEDVADWISITFFAGLHVALGFVIGRWWALVVYALPIAVSIPAGRPPCSITTSPLPSGGSGSTEPFSPCP
jgi:hypothetical protein